MTRRSTKPDDLRWFKRDDGRRFRNMPLNLADRKELLSQQGLVPTPQWWRRHRQLNWLEHEFEILVRHGIVMEDGQPR